MKKKQSARAASALLPLLHAGIPGAMAPGYNISAFQPHFFRHPRPEEQAS
jgi:hypothetical protein